MVFKMSKNSSLSIEQVVNLARLAQLKLTDVEVKTYQKDLNAIFKYIEVLDGVAIKDVKPTSQVTGLENVTRPDEVRKQLATPQQLMALTPKHEDGYIKVKRMIK